MLKDKKTLKKFKNIVSLNKTFNHKNKFKLPKKRWVWQLLTSSFLLILFLTTIHLELPGNKVFSEYLSYYLHEEESDLTPVIKTVVSTGLWLDSVDRQTYLNDYEEVKKADLDGIGLPVSGTFIQEFGWINSPVDKNKRFHSGIDIETEVGTPIRAALGGEVVKIWEDTELGRSIEIKHGRDLSTVYSNCSEVLVVEGQKVNKGHIIGKVGEGATSGKLHFEIRHKNEPIDPLPILNKEDSKI